MSARSTVTVRWLQPPRYFGMVERVARSRVRQRGQLSVGDEVRVQYKRCFYKARIIEDSDVLSAEAVSTTSATTTTPATPALPPPPAPRSVASTPSQEGASSWNESPPSSPWQPSTPMEEQPLLPEGDAELDSSFDSEGSVDSLPMYVSQDEAQEEAQRLVGLRLSGGLHPTMDTIPTSPSEHHECIDEQLLHDIVDSAVQSQQGEDDVRTSSIRRFFDFLKRNVARVEEEFLPRVRSVLEDLACEDPPCVRCLVNVTKTERRLEGLRENLVVFLGVAEMSLYKSAEE